MTNNIDVFMNLSNEDLYELIESDNSIDVDLTLNELTSTEPLNELIFTEALNELISIESLNELMSAKPLNEKLTVEFTPMLKIPSQLKTISLKKMRLLVQKIICKIYKENPKISDKDLIDAVVALLGLKGDWVVALVILLINSGLKHLCSRNS